MIKRYKRLASLRRSLYIKYLSHESLQEMPPSIFGRPLYLWVKPLVWEVSRSEAKFRLRIKGL